MQTSYSSFGFSRKQIITFFAVVVMVYFLSVAVKRFQKQVAYDAIAGNEPARLAFLVRQACNPGGSILGISAIDIDGTDTETLFSIATQIKDLNAVRDSYQKQFSEELYDRLSAELSRDDLERWLNLAGNPNTPIQPVMGKSLVYATNTATVYDYDDSRVVLKTLKAGELAGTYEGYRDLKAANATNYTRYAIVSFPKYLFLTAKGYIKYDLVKFA